MRHFLYNNLPVALKKGQGQEKIMDRPIKYSKLKRLNRKLNSICDFRERKEERKEDFSLWEICMKGTHNFLSYFWNVSVILKLF